MTTLLNIADKQAQAAALAAQLAEYQANGGRVLTVTKDTVIEPQPHVEWVTETAKPLQIIKPKTAPLLMQVKPVAAKQPKSTVKKQRQECTNTIIGKQRRADILEYMRDAGVPVTRQMIAEHVGMTVHGGLKHQILQLIKSGLINISHVVGKGGKQFYGVTT